MTFVPPEPVIRVHPTPKPPDVRTAQDLHDAIVAHVGTFYILDEDNADLGISSPISRNDLLDELAGIEPSAPTPYRIVDHEQGVRGKVLGFMTLQSVDSDA